LKSSTSLGVNANEIGSKLVIETKAIAARQSRLNRWHKGRNVVGLRHLSSTREGDDVFGKLS
jgi:hypothetical protein